MLIRIGKIIGLVGLFLALVLALAILLALVRWDRSFSVPTPNIHASTDSSIIARGRYLAYGPAHCADCHAPPESKAKTDSGQSVAMTGGYSIPTFLGEIRPPNITSDSATGIGAMTDGELARFFRYGVNRKGQVGLPIMMMPDLDDEDLIAVISFLRSTPPVQNTVPASDYNLLGKITRAFFLKPFSPGQNPVPIQKPELSAEYGRYLVHTVSNCASCHTERNMKTGEYTGPSLAGGMIFRNRYDAKLVVISSNLTPDSTTGRIFNWSKEDFIKRFKHGNLGNWSPMPWGPFSQMSDRDIGAIYLYLRQLTPVYKLNTLPK